MSNIAFFNGICEQKTLKDALTGQGFLSPKPYDPGNGIKNDGLKFEKEGWLIPTHSDQVKGVCVHYESKCPGHLCVHVEIDPYEKGKSMNEEDDPRFITLASELKIKAMLLQNIQEYFSENKEVSAAVYALPLPPRSTDHPNTNAAVKFQKLGKDCTTEECAEFFAIVINLVTPAIDTIVANHLTTLSSGKTGQPSKT